jgi:hypothetical protein
MVVGGERRHDAEEDEQPLMTRSHGPAMWTT